MARAVRRVLVPSQELTSWQRVPCFYCCLVAWNSADDAGLRCKWHCDGAGPIINFLSLSSEFESNCCYCAVNTMASYPIPHLQLEYKPTPPPWFIALFISIVVCWYRKSSTPSFSSKQYDPLMATAGDRSPDWNTLLHESNVLRGSPMALHTGM